MRITTVLFDLDGTLLPMNQDEFTKGYFKLLAAKLALHGYEPKQLVDTIWACMTAMVKNGGTCSNEEVFWEKFAAIYGEKALADKPLFEEFYEKEFEGAKAYCKFNPRAPKAIHRIQEMGYRVVLATNPIFPAVATEARIRWAGLEPSDFELYTTYENFGYCKPNPAYYKEILDRLNVVPEKCLMVGNNVKEDMVAQVLGIQVFLLTDCLINKERVDINQFPRGSYNRLFEYIEESQKECVRFYPE